MYTPFQPDSNLYLPDPVPDQISYCYYLPGTEKPAQLSLEDSWSKYKGYYIFLYNPIDHTKTDLLTALEKQLSATTALKQPTHTGAGWWMNTDQNSGLQSVLQAKTTDNGILVQEEVQLGFGTYQFPLFRDAPLLLNADGHLQAGYPNVTGAQTTAVEKSISIAVSGDMAGVLTGQVMINDFSAAEYTGWSAGFRYSMTDMDTGNLCSQYYPLFAPTQTTYWQFNVHWDPLHPLDDSRSYLTFTGISFGLEKIAGTDDRFQIVPGGDGAMLSYLRTIYGQPISLQPVTTGPSPAQLVFQTYADPATPTAYYLAPKGAFTLGIQQESAAACQLLPGLAGTEAISFTSGDQIIFYPGNAAYASAGLSSEELDTTYTVSWAFIKTRDSHTPVIYAAAPTVASLYQSSNTAGLLDAFYNATAQLPVEGTAALSFPLVPYAGLGASKGAPFSPDKIAPFETRLIAPARKKQMDAMPLPKLSDADAPSVVTTTPQGLLATIAGLNWQEVLLAHNTEIATDLRFVNLPAPLRNALQTNNLFLVISDNKNIGTFENALSIEGWQFNINIPARNPANDPDQRNILILKFRPGALFDLIADLTAWTDPISFNYDNNQLQGIQTWLLNYCIDAQSQQDEPQYANFLNIIQDPQWYGILALKVDINLGNFPKDLRGLLGAMDLKRFYAHHVGVQVNFVTQDAQNLDKPIAIKRSNMFGLINYTDPSYKRVQQSSGNNGNGNTQIVSDTNNSMQDATYSYKVLFLQIIFANTIITNFDSKLELTARKWFEEAASLNPPGTKADDTQPPANYSMIFDGHYENHDGHRTYTFLTRKGLSYQYFLTSEVLNYTDFVKAQFQTVNSVPEKAVPTTELVTSKFTFYGYLNFRDLENFDCFSFGAAKGQELLPARGLYFSNLALDVSFKLDTKLNATSGLSISLNTANTAFDQSLSTVRDKSFAAAFPISPNDILQGSGDNTPKKLNYLQVVPPVNFTTAGLQDSWYAINFDVHWGGPGALASQKGFIPQLLLAWSPGAGTTNVGIFLQLPGSGGGGNTFSIQNVLKLSAGPFQLKKVVHDGDKVSYNLFLINLSLSLFGLKLPPAGNVNLVLLGDQEQPGSLGWYGAYINL
ncbi:hypothetical protein [Chitinophaga sp. RAB17]|uniref:hypothetical protein n=1 Tax=Chitinophaga sp. RAB17 TaxID=3233049 RepID=UPI003F8F5D86